jgi:hypothetical protein
MRTLTSEQAEMQRAISEIEAGLSMAAAAHSRFRQARESLFAQARPADGTRVSQKLIDSQVPLSDDRLTKSIVDRLHALGLEAVANGQHSRHRAHAGPEWVEQMRAAIEAVPLGDDAGSTGHQHAPSTRIAGSPRVSGPSPMGRPRRVRE